MSSNDNKQVESFKIQDILTKENYIIPIYQRNYDWLYGEITQLIQDIWDYCQAGRQNYYIGTLVTHYRDKDKKYEVLDGQQRLTTLYILVAALKSLGQEQDIKDITETLNLHFEARQESTETLKNILENKIEGEQQPIIDGFGFAKGYLEEQIKKEDLQTFVEYLLNKVILVRTKVPKDTDLNHYFEIMNNRGEQLEKHEILKAQLLSHIDEENRSKYAKVWEACSQMNSYVQMNFDKSDRDKLFGNDWNCLDIKKIGGIQKVGDNEEVGDNENTIDCILKKGISENGNSKNEGNHPEEDEEKFESIIDFPNFLLQVLKAQYDENVSLDDKNLLKEFDKSKTDGKFTEKFAKKFIKNLLNYRFWFDKYIIKRNLANEEDNWSLQKLNNDNNYVNSFGDENKNIIMIQTMFHVSNSSKSNKRWLQEVFAKNKDYIKKGNIEKEKYDCFLKRLEQTSRDLLDSKYNCLNELSYNGNRPSIYLFNLLDYVIWKSDIENKGNFTFKFRNSIEHLYPQSKVANLKRGNGEQQGFSDEDKQKVLHSFGNLALTTRGENSKFSNFQPQNKVKEVGNIENQSLKYQLMAEKAKIWNNKTTINQHQTEMQKLLYGYLQKEQP